MEQKWPTFKDHDAVVCYDCKQLITDNKRGAYSAASTAGHGQFNKICQCGTVTFYDLVRACRCQDCHHFPLTAGTCRLGKNMDGCCCVDFEMASGEEYKKSCRPRPETQREFGGLG